VVNDGIHGMREEGQSYPLARGYHKLRIEYFQNTGGIGLEFLVEAPGEKKTIVPTSWLFN
jgi:alpha-L-fucosidase